MNANSTAMPQPSLSEGTYQEMLGRETQGWSPLRLMLAAGLTVVALGIIATLLP